MMNSNRVSLYQTRPFKKDVKRLGKKYPHLCDDLEELSKVIRVRPIRPSGESAVIKQPGDDVRIIKTRMACQDLMGKHTLRVIYAYHQQAERVDLIELYAKSDQENEDDKRIKAYLSASL